MCISRYTCHISCFPLSRIPGPSHFHQPPGGLCGLPLCCGHGKCFGCRCGMPSHWRHHLPKGFWPLVTLTYWTGTSAWHVRSDFLDLRNYCLAFGCSLLKIVDYLGWYVMVIQNFCTPIPEGGRPAIVWQCLDIIQSGLRILSHTMIRMILLNYTYCWVCLSGFEDPLTSFEGVPISAHLQALERKHPSKCLKLWRLDWATARQIDGWIDG